MSTPPDGKSAVVKLTLKRADLVEIVKRDELLKGSALMKALGSKGEALLAVGVARRYPPGAVLFQQGDAGHSLFLVLRGEVRLSGRKGTDRVELGTASRGEVCGEAEVLSGEPLRGSIAVAQGEVEAAEFPRDALLERGALMRAVADLLLPIKKARFDVLSEMTDFMNRW